MNKQILLSILVVATLVALVSGATFAYFSDTETSSGNTFTAGTLDLTIDNECYYNDEKLDECTWGLRSLDGEKFFNFNDVKPGHHGEDTISLHVTNDAWVCVRVYNLKNYENGCNEPEGYVDGTCGNPGEGEGELQDHLFFTVWRDDDCNNKLDDGEQVLVEDQKAKEVTWAIADSTTGEPLRFCNVYCIGVKWYVVPETGNEAQSDGLTADVKFWAEQYVNNEDFVCKKIKRYPETENAYVGYEDREAGDFDYNDFGIMNMYLQDVYVEDCLSEIDMEFTAKIHEAGDNHDIHIKRKFSPDTDYDYTITRTTAAQGTETPAGSGSGSGDFDIILFDSAYFAVGDKVTVNIKITDGCEAYDPSPSPPRWDLDPIFAYYDPWMKDRSINAERHIDDWQPAVSPLPTTGYNVPYILIVPVTDWNPPSEGQVITNKYPNFDDYYSTGSPTNWYV